jgi:hypothetical protein
VPWIVPTGRFPSRARHRVVVFETDKQSRTSNAYCHTSEVRVVMIEGQVYRCQNRDCACEIRVLRGSIEAAANPRCCCGTEMKKPYRKPMLRTLNSEMEVLTMARTNKI